MAKVKYSEDVQPLLNQHFGFTFQPNINGQSLFPASRSKRFRHPRQHTRQHNNQKAVTQWRNMAPEIQTAWNNFAAAYQQPAKRNPSIFLSGYQIFIKRNSYCFLNNGIESEFMEAPTMETKTYEETLFVLEAGDNVVDLTELYISNFGLLPTPSQWVLFSAIPYSDKSGQFFPPILETLEVKSVYMDGFFLNLTLPPESSDIVYSIYLSKPVSAGKSYAGTKIRYMGCFTSKKFTSLTDVPTPTPADTGKVWGVAPDGTWSLIPQSGGGGITCEDLEECEVINDIQSEIQLLYNALITSGISSNPTIKNGLIYKYDTINSIKFLKTGWTVPTSVQWNALITYLGGRYVAGGKLIEPNLSYWVEINSLADNSKKFNGRGSAYRNVAGGFLDLKTYGWFWAINLYSLNNSYYFQLSSASNSAYVSAGAGMRWGGYCVRIMKSAAGISDGVLGTYTGHNGNIYRTVVINQIEYLADNLAETILSDGTVIEEITSPTDWADHLKTGFCAYNNDWNYV